MAKFTATLSGATDNEQVLNIKTPRDNDGWGATIFVYGTFDSGTVKIQLSPDGGSTKIDAIDTNGSGISFTSDGYATIVTGIGNKNDEQIQLYADLTGATSASVTVDVFDVR